MSDPSAAQLERLAIEICWAGFFKPPRGGKFKYWARVSEEFKEIYRENARVVWAYAHLKPVALKQKKAPRRYLSETLKYSKHLGDTPPTTL